MEIKRKKVIDYKINYTELMDTYFLMLDVKLCELFLLFSFKIKS